MNQTPEMDEKKTSSPETAPIAATAEHNANFEENIRAIIRSGKPASVIRDDLDNYHANDIAEVLETLDTALFWRSRRSRPPCPTIIVVRASIRNPSWASSKRIVTTARAAAADL